MLTATYVRQGKLKSPPVDLTVYEHLVLVVALINTFGIKIRIVLFITKNLLAQVRY